MQKVILGDLRHFWSGSLFVVFIAILLLEAWCRRIAEQGRDIKGLMQAIEKRGLLSADEECGRLVNSITDKLRELNIYLTSLTNHCQNPLWW